MNIGDTTMCIYIITNRLTLKSYVGKSVGKVKKRWQYHCTVESRCTKLRNSIQKYGKESFDFSILEVCVDRLELAQREQYWIKNLNTLSPGGYNLTVGGENPQVSEETKAKMVSSAKLRPKPSKESIELRAVATRGQKRTPEQVENIRQSQLNKSYMISDYTRNLISIAGKNRVMSQTHIDKIRASKVGKKRAEFSIEWKLKMSVSQKLRFKKEKELTNGHC